MAVNGVIEARAYSNANRLLPKCDVRLTPESGHVQRDSPCPLWANSGLVQCGKKDRYSNTSSARPTNVLGTLRPNALAVLRLM